MSNGDNLIRLTADEMEKLSELEGRLIDYEKELARARMAGLESDLNIEKREGELIEMRRKIGKIKTVYKPE